jgi:phage terminase small subunit
MLLPTEIKRLRGTLQPCRTNPNEPKPAEPLGDPPSHLLRDERAAWRELQRMTVVGVLTMQDRWVVELSCILMAKVRRRETLGGAERAQLTQLLCRMGLAPADRAKVSVMPQSKDDDDISMFVN